MPKVWSIQTCAAWQHLQETGTLQADAAYVYPAWLSAYAWMARQLAQRIGPAPAGCTLPIWVWYQWNGQRQARPDLRFKAHLPSGSHGVRLTLSIPHTRLLCSDFDLWHYPLSQMYLPQTYAESIWLDTYADAYGHSSPVLDQRKLEQSWERIFDLSWEEPEMAHPQAKKSIQGVLWELRLTDVLAVEYFRAR